MRDWDIENFRFLGYKASSSSTFEVTPITPPPSLKIAQNDLMTCDSKERIQPYHASLARRYK
jgi:hypothetical protein